MQHNSRTNNRQKRQTTYRENPTYIQGNTVRKAMPAEYPEAPVRELSHRTRKNRDKALHMNFGYVLFLVAALASAALVLISYIQIQSEITYTVKQIASLERELNHLKLSNDEQYNRAVGSVDLEEIKRVAIGELGMRYAKEGQIINVTGEGSDYVRQLAEIGDQTE